MVDPPTNGKEQRAEFELVKYWEVIAENLSKLAADVGASQLSDSNGRIVWIVDAHRDGNRCVVIERHEHAVISKKVGNRHHLRVRSALDNPWRAGMRPTPPVQPNIA